MSTLETLNEVVGNYQKQIDKHKELHEINDSIIKAYKTELEDVNKVLASAQALIVLYRKFNLKQ